MIPMFVSPMSAQGVASIGLLCLRAPEGHCLPALCHIEIFDSQTARQRGRLDQIQRREIMRKDELFEAWLYRVRSHPRACACPWPKRTAQTGPSDRAATRSEARQPSTSAIIFCSSVRFALIVTGPKLPAGTPWSRTWGDQGQQPTTSNRHNTLRDTIVARCVSAI